MALRITRASEPMPVKQIVMLIFGQPGAGKSSLSFTAHKPLMLDFDHGAYRSAFRQDVVEVENWSDVAQLPAEDLAEYDTITVDTVGRALDKITAHIVATQPKMANAAGSLTLQGYGELKTVFTGWIKQLRELGKDVVLIAHDAEDKQGDNLIVRPDAIGGSKNELIKVADAIGYLYQADKKTVLDFNPTDRWIGKNCAGFDPLVVPNFANDPGYLGKLIQQTKDALNQQTDAQREVAEKMAEWQNRINECGTAADLNALLAEARGLDEPVKGNVGRMFAAKARDLGVKFDMDSNQYTAPEEAAA